MIEKQERKKRSKIAHSNDEIAKRKRKTTSTLRRSLDVAISFGVCFRVKRW
jgi:hypothetical protein